MRLDALTYVPQLLDRLDASVAKVASLDIPVIKGRFRALDAAWTTMGAERCTAEYAVAVLDQAGVDPESIRQVKEAARLLGVRPRREAHVHVAAERFERAVADVRTRNRDLFAAAEARFDAEVAPARDVLATIDGPPTGEQRAALAAALRFDPQFGMSANARLQRRLVDSLPLETRVSVLRDLVSRPAFDLEPDELRFMRALVDVRPRGQAGDVFDFDGTLPSAGRLEHAITGAAERSSPRSVVELDRYVAREMVGRMPHDERVEIARRLFRMDPSDLTPHEWNLLEQVTDGSMVGYHAGIVNWMPGRETISRHIATSTMQGLPPSDLTYAYFDANLHQGLSNRELTLLAEARFHRAIDEALVGTLSKRSQNILNASWSSMSERVSRMPIEQQARIATAMLGLPSGASGDRRAVGTALRAIRTDLATMTVPTKFEDLYSRTKVLVERNIGRIEGRHEPDAVRGYGEHPDYAEVGQVRANVVLLHAVRDMAAGEATAAATAGRGLTW